MITRIYKVYIQLMILCISSTTTTTSNVSNYNDTFYYADVTTPRKYQTDNYYGSFSFARQKCINYKMHSCLGAPIARVCVCVCN